METNLMLLYLIVQMRCSVKLNTPDGDGNSTIGNFSPSCKRLAVKLNNPLMGKEVRFVVLMPQHFVLMMLILIILIRGQRKSILSFKDKNNHSFVGWLFCV